MGWSGHGNGGKYYLREMFKYSKIVTYRNSRLNVFGFENKQYGIDEDFNDIHVGLDEAVAATGLDEFGQVGDYLKEIILKRKNFSFIVGSNPKTVLGTNKIKTLMEKLISHPQARRLIQRKKIF